MPGGALFGVAGLRWVASPVINNLLNRSLKYLGRDITKELEDLKTIVVPELELTFQAFRNSPDDEAELIADWLGLLRDAFYDAENILHKLEYKFHKRTAHGKDNKLWVHISSYPIIKPLAKFFIKKFLLLSKLGRRLKKLMKIAAKAKALRILIIQTRKIKNATVSDTSPPVNNPPATSSLLPDDPIFGRDKDRDYIINCLLDGERDSVVAITGVGGNGKTTLAQYVYNDERIINHFGVKMWVCNVCLTQKLDVEQCTMNMIESASMDSKVKFPDISKDSTLDMLHHSLKKILDQFETILLVLDDVWYDEKAGDGQWENLLKPFNIKKGRCKFLVTSRSQQFPTKLRSGIHIELRDLSNDAFLSLFRYFAFKGVENIDPRFSKIGDDIAKKIAKKMSKSPLAAKFIGNQLSSKKSDIDFWRKALITVNVSSIRQVLQWSYNRLDAPLQRCFLFCSMFEKGKRFQKMDLVRYWVALDFIRPLDDKIASDEDIQPSDHKNASVEDIGLEYLDKMVANSIFQLVDKWFIMHDVFRDLAKKLSAGDCLRVIDSKKVNAKDKVVHLFLEGNYENLKANLSEISNLRNLRALVMVINPSIEDASEIFSIITRTFKYLRVLRIECRGLKTLPSVVGDLKNLRHLTIWGSLMDKLPDSISDLYYLQYLIIPDSVKNLPTKTSNLIKLRNILTYKRDGVRAKTLPPIAYLGKLTSLQCLDEFHVRKEEGYKIGQLGNLREIGGSLRIVGLENVRDKNEAVEAKLKDKTKLEGLEMVWSKSAESRSEVEVIKALRPPENLKLLKIDGYRDSSYPEWLQGGSILQNITHVRFLNCNALSSLPPNFHQFRYCTKVVLANLGALRELSILPENLTTLRIIKCPCLILVSEEELRLDAYQRGIMRREFLTRDFEFSKNLFHHEIKSFKHTGSRENCPEQFKIIETALQINDAHDLQSNVMRAWWSCHQQRMNFIFSNTTRANKLIKPNSRLRILELRYCCISNGALSDYLEGKATLEELHLEGIMTITTLPPAEVFSTLASLQVLEIKHCWCLTSLYGFYALPGNQKLPSRKVRDGLELLPSLHKTRIPGSRDVVVKDYTSKHVCRAIIRTGHGLPFTYNDLEPSEPSRCYICDDVLYEYVRPSIDTLSLVLLPNLLESLFFKGCQQLIISTSMTLNKLLTYRNIVVPPKILEIRYCQEEAITLKKSDHLQSIRTLCFTECKTKNLPTSLSDFSSLKNIIFTNCPEISVLPELPGAVQYMKISGCQVLKKRCQPNGPDWQKIQHIKTIEIQ